ncbi:MAG: hypothetical protein AAFO78_00740 [Pseudomonadota bacterium]
MILRRITQHVKDQNWTAIGIDFVIVVVGVFMGIQLGNWNDVRAERARGESIKARLAAEFIDIEPQIARHVRNVTKYRDLANELAEDVLSGTIDLQTQEFADRSLAIGWHAPTGGSNTVAELINQGDIDLLGSPDLVDLLMEFQSTSVRHITAGAALYEGADKDFKPIGYVSRLAAIPPERRSEEFTAALSERASPPDVYVRIRSASLNIEIDLDWHQRTLELACGVLQKLGEPCNASDALASGDSP